MVGDKDQHGVGIRIFRVLLDRFEFVFIRAAPKEVLYAAHKKYLERCHERRRASAIEDFRQISFAQIKVKEAKFPHIGRNQILKNGLAALLAEENFVADKNIDRAQRAGFDFGDKALGLREGAHQNASRIFETRVRANSRERR